MSMAQRKQEGPQSKVQTAIWGKGARPVGEAPSIILCDPKYPHNVGMVLRLASCFGLKQVWYTGERVNKELHERGRMPREERMKDYQSVKLINYDYPFDMFPQGTTPVAIEVRENSEPLHTFVHPANPVYVFGPEDGSIPSVLLRHCHRFVVIPTRHCLNLATATTAVLWDRQYKRFANGEETDLTTPGQHEKRGLDVFDKTWELV